MKKKSSYKYHYGFQLVSVGALTGVFAGVVVTLYNILASKAEHLAKGIYELIRTNPVFVPLLFVALFIGAIIVGGIVKFIPMIRGSGIPQTEGATRGLLHFRWYEVLTGMFACSLFTIFMGLSAGSEGPSIQIGAACGQATSDLLKRNETVRRYQITGGACTGLAVAFNAPLTGMAFAFEEAHKRFTPEVFVCSFSSVIVGVITRNLLRPLFGLSTTSTFSTYVFESPNLISYLYILFAAIVCGLVGVGFYFLVLRAKKLFSKITFWGGVGKMIIPFLLGGAFGLITSDVMGGGHELIESLSRANYLAGEGLKAVYSSPIWATLIIVLVLKFTISVVNMGSGVPCGVFIPMLAIGACLGAMLSWVSVQCGMDPAYSDLMVMICMAAFFTTVVKAPITAIVMVLELTWSFTFLLPVILGVAVGYLVGDVFRTEPIYEKMLEGFLVEQKVHENEEKVTVRLRVKKGSQADGRAVRDILWPTGARVTSLYHHGRHRVPNGDTLLKESDEIIVSGETADAKNFAQLLSSIVGDVLETVIQEPERETEEEQKTT